LERGGDGESPLGVPENDRQDLRLAWRNRHAELLDHVAQSHGLVAQVHSSLRFFVHECDAGAQRSGERRRWRSREHECARSLKEVLDRPLGSSHEGSCDAECLPSRIDGYKHVVFDACFFDQAAAGLTVHANRVGLVHDERCS
jgi:hypothetical protein